MTVSPPSPRAQSRRQARRAAFVVLYQADVLGTAPEPLLERHAADTGQPTDAYTREVVDGVLGASGRLDALVDGAADGWTARRLGAVERAVLRLALWEMLDREDVPAPVAIDEAVELARRYASPEAATFVNGVLGRIARDRGVGR